jgi:hypothetical protein
MLSDPKAYRFRPVSLADLPRRYYGPPAIADPGATFHFTLPVAAETGSC